MPGGAGETPIDDMNHSDSRRLLMRILHVRHNSLFVPRDFDVSPYFAVIKPTLVAGFDHRALAWNDRPAAPRDTVRMAVP